MNLVFKKRLALNKLVFFSLSMVFNYINCSDADVLNPEEEVIERVYDNGETAPCGSVIVRGGHGYCFDRSILRQVVEERLDGVIDRTSKTVIAGIGEVSLWEVKEARNRMFKRLADRAEKRMAEKDR